MTGVLGFLAWIALSVVDLKTDTAVIATKVDANHQMLTPLWRDFIRNTNDGNIAWLNSTANIKTPAKEKVE